MGANGLLNPARFSQLSVSVVYFTNKNTCSDVHKSMLFVICPRAVASAWAFAHPLSCTALQTQLTEVETVSAARREKLELEVFTLKSEIEEHLDTIRKLESMPASFAPPPLCVSRYNASVRCFLCFYHSCP